MTTYSINFTNNTPETWTLCVYQTLPSSPGLKSVSWKQTTVPHGGVSGVQWEINYQACLAGYKQIGGKGVYKASQILQTDLGQQWDAVYKDNVQQLEAAGATDPGKLLIQNKSGALANPAIGVDGSIALVKSDVYSGNDAQFLVDPTYWVALYSDVTLGEVISGNQVHGPLMVKFDGGATSLDFEAEIQNETFVFKQTGSGLQMSAPVNEVKTRVQNLSAL